MNIETILAIIGALGGWEAIKYLVNRSINKRKEQAEADKAEAEADSANFGTLRETIEFLQQQLKEKEERFANQTDRLRKVQDDYFTLMQEHAKTELDLQRYRCVVKGCPNREPQNGY